MQANPRYRPSHATLPKLADWHVFFDLKPAQPRGLPPLAALGQRVAAQLAKQPVADRSAALDKASLTLLRLTGLRAFTGFTPDERQAWRRWSPFVLALPGLTRWNPAERRALVRIVRAKGSRREGDFATLFTQHPRLTQTLFSLR